MQLTHSTTTFESRQFPITILLDNITSEANIGSIFRLADAFGVEKLLFHGTIPNLQSNRLKRTARNTHNTVAYEVFEDATAPITNLKQMGYKMVAIEITSQSEAISHFKNIGEKKKEINMIEKTATMVAPRIPKTLFRNWGMRPTSKFRINSLRLRPSIRLSSFTPR